jgi:sugar/nucleoside kinase (ribokinase family)
MLRAPGLEPIDYLLLGHITLDETPDGARPGGTALYSALTACALGHRVGLVTSWGEELPLPAHPNLQVVNLSAEVSTTFRLDYGPEGRRLTLLARAAELDFFHIPELWRAAPLVHLGPVAGEVNTGILRHLEPGQACLTPQGWLRGWDEHGAVRPADWPEAEFALRRCRAAVLGREDLPAGRLEAYALAAPLLVVTDGPRPAVIWQDGEETHFAPPEAAEVDATGAGDIFAAAFFIRLHAGDAPLAAAQTAARLAADSVTRRGLEGVPQSDLSFEVR